MKWTKAALSLLTVATLIIFSCRDNSNSPAHTETPFSFQKNEVRDRVTLFLKEENLLSDSINHYFFFNSGKGCSSCTKDIFLDMETLLNTTKVRTVLIINDDLIMNHLDLNNDLITTYTVDKDTLINRKIYHSFPYLYSFNGEKWREIKLDLNGLKLLQNSDSLNVK